MDVLIRLAIVIGLAIFFTAVVWGGVTLSNRKEARKQLRASAEQAAVSEQTQQPDE